MLALTLENELEDTDKMNNFLGKCKLLPKSNWKRGRKIEGINHHRQNWKYISRII